MSLDATEIMRSTMDTCLKFISGDMPLSKEGMNEQNDFISLSPILKIISHDTL
jgi:hypothetical protein